MDVVSNNVVKTRFWFIVFTMGSDLSSGVLLLGSLGVVILIRRWKSA